MRYSRGEPESESCLGLQNSADRLDPSNDPSEALSTL